MKKNLVLVLLPLLMVGCTERIPRIPFPDWGLPDSGIIEIPSPDAGVCDPRDYVTLRTDFNNCGSCGHYCNLDFADRCFEARCMCGINEECPRGSGCRFGNCVVSDRHTLCEDDSGCRSDQDCLRDIDGNSYCVAVCEFDDACPPQHACIEGACTYVSCVPEDCDGLDNDCDGLVDESGRGPGPWARYCYSGPETDFMSIMPPCRAGVQVCLPSGHWSECRDEVPPQIEQGLLACDGEDNDCDGCVDGVLEEGICESGEPTGFDVVFVVDTSGSMSSTISAVRMAVDTFSAVFSASPEFRFGIVLAPGSMDSEVELYHDLSLFPAFQTALMSMSTGSGGSEPTWDAVYALGSEELPMSWRDGTIRIIVVFTDEEGQSYRSTNGLGPNVNEFDMCASLMHGEVLATVTVPAHTRDFDDCGLVFNLTSDAEMMVDQLNTIISDPCR